MAANPKAARKKQKSRPTAKDAAQRLVIWARVTEYALREPPRDMLQEWMDKWSAEDREDFARKVEPDREEFWQSVRDEGLWEHLSPDEQEFASRTLVTMTNREQIDASWRIESVQALMWALNLIPKLPPYDDMADHDLLLRIPCDGFAEFIRAARLRKRAEIDRARDIAELWHWRSRERELIEEDRPFPKNEKVAALGFHSRDDVIRFTARMLAERGKIPAPIDEDFPALGKAYRDLSGEEWWKVGMIAIERHFTLNWLCGYAPGNRWDKTPTHT
jgi:hypothetical protein